ncbi:CRISPR-associated endonuclease Cas3'' [Methylobacterium sp. ID0610]|uniref:CRISPR-associated endonuclease Cas3'' n=1 Tax=Methylobacterium carpenticola TaxID=3344827 RepID=UPI0036C92E32
MPVYGHSLPGEDPSYWELLSDHSRAVAEGAKEFASVFGCGWLAEAAGCLHDIGKCSAEVQAYLHGEGPSRDHSTAGARVAVARYPHPLGRMLALVIAGHHAGLDDAEGIDRRLDAAATPIPAYDGWEAHAGPLPSPQRFVLERNRRTGFAESFLIRMLFSCLVDADFLKTERFYKQKVSRGLGLPIPVLRDRLRAHMAEKRAVAKPTPVNALRAEVLDHILGRAALPPGLFTLTVPTGGGKTLASLSFALDHAKEHGLRRVVYVIPYTSIIEQTAAVFRAALGDDAGVLEHHASFDWEVAGRSGDAGWGADATAALRRAAENWDAPIVVTTAVQFFESLFAVRTSRCRKLHNLARSVIVLDEAQSLPRHLLAPCMAALEELATNYGATVVLCTATQPALRECDGFEGGFKIGPDRELAPDPQRLARALKRVRVERRSGPVPDAEIAARFAAEPQMLCIVNGRAHAQTLFGLIAEQPGAAHLSTLMCPRHRRAVLDEARTRIKDGKPARIVSTSLIEAGVDIDLPEVWRAAGGLDSIAQAAGRCNREGTRPDLGRLVVFEPEGGIGHAEMAEFWKAAKLAMGESDDPLGLDAIQRYFREVYWRIGPDALDAAKIEGKVFPILLRVAERTNAFTFPFRSIAEAFRVIPDAMETAIVPWRAGPDDDEAETILGRIGSMDRPLADDLRRLQSYTVSIPKPQRDAWLKTGILRQVHPGLGDAVLRFQELGDHYDPRMGIRLDGGMARSADSNVIG